MAPNKQNKKQPLIILYHASLRTVRGQVLPSQIAGIATEADMAIYDAQDAMGAVDAAGVWQHPVYGAVYHH